MARCSHVLIGMNTNTRMTDEAIDQTVAGMRMTDAERAKLARLAKAGEPGARFVVYSRYLKAGPGDARWPSAEEVR